MCKKNREGFHILLRALSLWKSENILMLSILHSFKRFILFIKNLSHYHLKDLWMLAWLLMVITKISCLYFPFDLRLFINRGWHCLEIMFSPYYFAKQEPTKSHNSIDPRPLSFFLHPPQTYNIFILCMYAFVS